MADNNPSDVTEKQIDNSKPWRWKAGESGNPAGRPKKGLAVTDVMHQMLEEKPEIKKALAAKLFEMAIGGDITAIRELLNRLEGMPKQENEMTGGLEINTNINDYRSKHHPPTETERSSGSE